MYEASYSGPEADIRVTDEDPKIALSVCAFRIATESIETPVDRPGYPISWEDRLEWMNELFRDHGSPGDDLPAYIRLEVSSEREMQTIVQAITDRLGLDDFRELPFADWSRLDVLDRPEEVIERDPRKSVWKIIEDVID